LVAEKQEMTIFGSDSVLQENFFFAFRQVRLIYVFISGHGVVDSCLQSVVVSRDKRRRDDREDHTWEIYTVLINLCL